MAKWKNLFQPQILARGQEYYECGQVEELKQIGATVYAEVGENRRTIGSYNTYSVQ